MIISRIKTKDTEVITELNFDLDKWAEQLGVKLTEEVLIEANQHLREDITQRFANFRGPDNESWPSKSHYTMQSYARQGISNPFPLQRTGGLRDSFVSSIYGDEVTISTNKIYARVQQFGASYSTTARQSVYLWYNVFERKGNPFKSHKIRIPKRTFLGFGEHNISKIRDIIKRRVLKTERMGTYDIK